MYGYSVTKPCDVVYPTSQSWHPKCFSCVSDGRQTTCFVITTHFTLLYFTATEKGIEKSGLFAELYNQRDIVVVIFKVFLNDV